MSESPDYERVVVAIPCYNEQATVVKVIRDFEAVLPGATILVIDNNSVDDTRRLAEEAGAVVLHEPRQGKGFALLTGLEWAAWADHVVMVDGDDTYPADAAPRLIARARTGVDMVVGTRLQVYDDKAFRPGHSFGNHLFVGIVRVLFGITTKDLFSGYRVLSRRYLTRVPLLAQGFEIEAELAIQASERNMVVEEEEIAYGTRPENSVSKLRTLQDGTRILLAIITFFRDYKPLTFFGVLAILLFSISLYAGGIVVLEYARTAYITRLPLAVFASATFVLASLSLVSGVILSSINRRASQIEELMVMARARPPRAGHATALPQWDRAGSGDLRQ